ncbi:hypothetical protein, partial [Klebsiella pneumoniae]|uniref:hypothetical protein n=1 Tax=Klebsiella pneumoniae TaxID=573 RepID=UPI00272F1574
MPFKPCAGIQDYLASFGDKKRIMRVSKHEDPSVRMSAQYLPCMIEINLTLLHEIFAVKFEAVSFQGHIYILVKE